MDLFRRKLWGDRVTWIGVVIATAFVVNQYVSKGGQLRLYILYAWSAIVLWLVFFSELRVGRRPPERGADALYASWAALVGEERLDPDGQRHRGWSGTAPGVMHFEPGGIRWTSTIAGHGPEETQIPWADLYTWRLVGVIPFVWRASGYLLLSLFGGREVVFHVHGVRGWRRALREAMIVGPTLAVPEPAEVPVPDAAAPPGYPASSASARGVSETSYEPVIGIECHVELSTASKMFCGCPTTFGAEPNTHVCPVCTGQPGSLPVPNRSAISHALSIALALNCSIVPESIFHRKNYFYPDMPKNYQISQYDIPLAKGGYLDYELDGETKRVGIERVHIEEDTGKTLHAGEGGRIGVGEFALIDYNRAGIPLVEVVTEPEIHTPEEARAYVAELRALLHTLGVSDVRMEEGSLRCDANVSIRRPGSDELGTKTEVKNMNSLRSLQRALAHEIERQAGLLEAGKEIVQETRHFDEDSGVTIGGRAKEYSSDYRYFPDPDLVPLAASQTWIDEIRWTIPELPARRRQRFATQYGLVLAEARTLTASKGLADAFEQAVTSYGSSAHPIARWYLGELAQIANERGVEPHEVVPPAHVAELQQLIDQKMVSDSMAKGEVLKQMVASGRAPGSIVEETGLAQISDEGELAAIVDRVIAAHPDVVSEIRGGKTGAINFLKGQVMKETKGQADPEVVGRLLAQRLPTPE